MLQVRKRSASIAKADIRAKCSKIRRWMTGLRVEAGIRAAMLKVRFRFMVGKFENAKTI
jgi:hypothetical protein